MLRSILFESTPSPRSTGATTLPTKGSLSACFVSFGASAIDGLANNAVSRTAPSSICIRAALVPRPLERISFASRNDFA